MNAPTPPQGHSSDDESDPTGVRDLLASLPDPGPMPDEVMTRIQSALADEQERRSGSDHGNVMPLLGRDSADEHVERVDTRGAGGGRVRWLRPLAAIGVAAAIGIGSLAGYQALRGGDAPPVAQPGQPSAPASGGDQQRSGLDRVVLDKISIQQSGRDYSASGLASEAAALKGAPTSTLDPQDAKALGSAATPEGLLTCMRKMGTEMIGSGVPDKISADLGQYEGQPAVVVLVSADGTDRAWVLSRTCTSGKAKLAGPTTVA